MKFNFEEYHRKKSLIWSYMLEQLKKTEKYIDCFNELNYLLLPEIKREFRTYIKGEFI